MAQNKSTLSVISIIISLATLMLVIIMLLTSGDKVEVSNHKLEKTLAGELADNNLYSAAIDKYKRILSDPNIDKETRANINYLIGKIYFDDLFDYENAAAHYIIARSLNPEGSFYAEAGKNLIASLEKMGRMIDAKRELDKSVSIDSIYAAHEGETVVAKIGDKPIFLTQIDEAIQSLPSEAQLQFAGKAGKLQFLNQYIGMELMYQASIREGFDNDREILKQKEELTKQLLIQKYIIDKVLPEVNIDTADVRNYYTANKDSKYEDKSYDEARNQVFMDYQQEKAQQAFSEYAARLSAVEKVQIFEENVK
jgi:hypothetical protein